MTKDQSITRVELIEKVERLVLESYQMTEAHLFWVSGYAPCLGLRPMTVLIFRRHPELLLPEGWVRDYLLLRASVDELETRGMCILQGTQCSEVSNRARMICRELRLDTAKMVQ